MIFTELLQFKFTSVAEQTLPALKNPADVNHLAMIYFGSNSVNGVTATDAAIFLGVSDGLGNQQSVAAFAKDNVSTTSLGTTQQNSHCGYLVDNTGTATARFFFDRLDDDGLGNKSIVVEHQVDPNDKQFNCYAIYGPGVLEVKVFKFQLATTVGVHSVNLGVSGLKDGDFLMLFTSYPTTLDNQSISASADILFQVGMATSIADQAYSSMFATDGTTTGNLNATRQVTGKLLAFYNTTTLFDELAFNGWTSNGFDYDLQVASGSAYWIYGIVVKGPQSKISAITVPTGTGDVNHDADCAFTPLSLFNASNSRGDGTTIVNLAHMSLGAGKSLTEGGACAFGFRSQLGGTNTEAAAVQSGTDTIKLASVAPVTNIFTVRKSARYKVSIPYMNPGSPDGGVTLNWATASSLATANQVICWFIGDEKTKTDIIGKTNVYGKTNIAVI